MAYNPHESERYYDKSKATDRGRAGRTFDAMKDKTRGLRNPFRQKPDTTPGIKHSKGQTNFGPKIPFTSKRLPSLTQNPGYMSRSDLSPLRIAGKNALQAGGTVIGAVPVAAALADTATETDAQRGVYGTELARLEAEGSPLRYLGKSGAYLSVGGKMIGQAAGKGYTALRDALTGEDQIGKMREAGFDPDVTGAFAGSEQYLDKPASTVAPVEPVTPAAAVEPTEEEIAAGAVAPEAGREGVGTVSSVDGLRKLSVKTQRPVGAVAPNIDVNARNKASIEASRNLRAQQLGIPREQLDIREGMKEGVDTRFTKVGESGGYGILGNDYEAMRRARMANRSMLRDRRDPKLSEADIAKIGQEQRAEDEARGQQIMHSVLGWTDPATAAAYDESMKAETGPSELELENMRLQNQGLRLENEQAGILSEAAKKDPSVLRKGKSGALTEAQLLQAMNRDRTADLAEQRFAHEQEQADINRMSDIRERYSSEDPRLARQGMLEAEAAYREDPQGRGGQMVRDLLADSWGKAVRSETGPVDKLLRFLTIQDMPKSFTGRDLKDYKFGDSRKSAEENKGKIWFDGDEVVGPTGFRMDRSEFRERDLHLLQMLADQKKYEEQNR